jgi:hypothetical protein
MQTTKIKCQQNILNTNVHTYFVLLYLLTQYIKYIYRTGCAIYPIYGNEASRKTNKEKTEVNNNLNNLCLLLQ